MDQPMLHPPLPEDYTDEWGRITAEDLGFAPAAEALLRNGRIEDARRLCEEGVRCHPWYATGHLLLGKTYMRGENWSDARAELERALQLDGAYPALLSDLAGCYEQLGLADLAVECRALGYDLDPRPLRDQEAEGPEPIGEDGIEEEEEDVPPVQVPEEGDVPELVGEEEEEEIEEAAAALEGMGEAEELSEEDSLRELEALFEGASAGLEGFEEDRGQEDLTEGGPDVAEDHEPEELAPEEESPEQREEGDLAAAAEAAAAAYGLGDLEGEEEEGGAEAGAEEDEKAELWKKIMEQAEQAEAGRAPDLSELESLAAPGEAGEEGEESDEEEPAIRGTDFEGMGEGPSEEVSEEVQPIEGLEISQPGGGLTDAGPEHFEEEGAEGEEEAGEAGGEDEERLVRGPSEVSEEAMEAASEGLDFESTMEVAGTAGEEEGEGPMVEGLEGLETTSFEEEEVPEAGAEEEELEAMADLDDLIGEEEEGAEEEQPEVAEAADEALRALEAELAGARPAGEEEPELDREEAAAGPADAEPAPEEPGSVPEEEEEEEEIGLDRAEDLETTAVQDPAKVEETGEEGEPAPTAGGMSIDNTEDSVRAAIRAEILAAQGKYKEALRYFEALQLWDPERTTFKERVEQLRRISQ
ncbi:MAG: hypothetical protein R6W82_00470 [bacterium]